MKTGTNKKRAMIALSVLLVAAIAIGGTFAYLFALTEQLDNAFSFAENVRGRLDEPNWDPDEARNLVPDYLVRKDPMVTNVSDNGVDVFTAIRATFTAGNGTILTSTEVARLLRLLDITWNTTNWERIASSPDNNQIWVYKGVLAPTETTPPLFSSVTVRSSFTPAEIAATPGLDWNEEFAWLASIIMTHTDACYTYGTHVTDGSCVITYRHHANCAIFGETDAATTAKGGTTNEKNCDCNPVEVHAATCPYNIAALSGTCECEPATGINGFHIVNRAAVVQADTAGMTAWNAAATTAELLAIFAANPYTP